MNDLINAYHGPDNLSDYIPMGILLLRNDFIVMSWNICLERWTGIKKDDILNKDIRDVFPHFSEPMYSSRLTTIFEGGPPAIFSSQLHKYIIPSKLPTGEMRFQHTVVTAVDSDQEQSLALFTIQDVTDFSLRMQEYFMLSKALKESNEDMKSFTYSVSHDLKAPLRAINGFSGILEKKLKPKLVEDEINLLNIIRGSVEEMSQLIEGLLALSRVGRKTLNHKPVNILELVEYVVAGQRVENQQQFDKVQLTIDQLPPCSGDPRLIKQIYINLISNAVKFSIEESAPEIRLGYKMDDQQVIYTVSDNGIGFDMKYVDKLFGVFQRLNRDDRFPGTGVGLAIVKRIVEKHNGTVWAEGELGKGATIMFTIGSLEE